MSRDPRRAVPAIVTALTALAVLAGCAPPDSPGADVGAAAAPAGLPPLVEETPDAPAGGGESARPSAPRDAPPPPVPRVAWPRGWRLVEAGSFGSDEDAVVWYRLEGPAQQPGEAARALLDALEPLTGLPASSHVADGASGASVTAVGAVGQLDGVRRRAGVHVRPERETLVALVILHPAAG